MLRVLHYLECNDIAWGQSPKWTMDGEGSISFFFSLVVPLSDFARNLSEGEAAAVLIGVRGKQIVLLEWDGMEWNDFAEVSSLTTGCLR